MRFPWQSESEAGRSALDYYRHSVRGWRQRNRIAFLVALLASCVAALPFWLYAPHGQFFAGLLIGGTCGMIVWIWDDPPEVIAKWRRGADGERYGERECD